MNKFWNIWKRGGLIYIILCREFNWIGHILRINCIVQDNFGGQMTEMKENLQDKMVRENS